MKPIARAICRGLLITIAVAGAVVFLSSVFPIETADEPIRRVTVALLPLLDGSIFADLFRADPDLPRGLLTRLAEPAIFILLFLALAFLLGDTLIRLIRFRSASPQERVFFALCLGTALLTVLPPLVMLWYPLLWLFAAGSIFALINEGVVCFRFFRAKDTKALSGNLPEDIPKFSEKLGVFGISALVLVLLLLLLTVIAAGAPPFEFDTLEYHAEAAREIARNGNIGFFSRNAYMNMPLAGEILLWWGNLSSSAVGAASIGDRLLAGTCRGKTLLAAMSFLAVLGLYAFSKRFPSTRAKRTGVIAALLFLAFPLVFENFSFGLVDGLLALALLAAAYAVAIYLTDPSGGLAAVLLAGAFAGWAAAIKYTGVVFVLLPAVSLLAATLIFSKRTRWGRGLLTFLAFIAAAFVFGGYWYLKNYFLTGNPVWPLAFSFFGDNTGSWSAAIQERWHQVHSPNGFGLSALFSSLRALLLGEPASAPVLILIPLLPLLFIRRQKRLIDTLLLGYTLLFLILWFFFTHRLTRFLVPIFPVVSLLIARAVNECDTERLWRPSVGFLVLLCGFYTLAVNIVMTSDLLVSPRRMARDSARCGEWSAWLAACDNQLPDAQNAVGTRLLLVGEARAFAYRIPIDYSTCWNRSPLAESLPESVIERLRSGTERIVLTDEEAAALREELARRDIGFLLYDEREIDRYLSPGNYGLTDAELLTPALITAMEKACLLRPVTPSAEDFEQFFSTNRPLKARLYRVEKPRRIEKSSSFPITDKKLPPKN